MEQWQFVVLLIAILSPAIGLGVAWGSMTTTVKNICKSFDACKTECDGKVTKLEKKVDAIDNKIEDHLSGMDGKHKVV